MLTTHTVMKAFSRRVMQQKRSEQTTIQMKKLPHGKTLYWVYMLNKLYTKKISLDWCLDHVIIPDYPKAQTYELIQICLSGLDYILSPRSWNQSKVTPRFSEVGTAWRIRNDISRK